MSVPVTTWTLEMRDASALTGPRTVPNPFEIVETTSLTPEFARFLYGLVGGPWKWTDRLAWTREQWETDLAAPGTMFLIAYANGQPQGYLQLGATSVGDSTEIEIKYFGLAMYAMGKGLGSVLLTRGLEKAWAADEYARLPHVSRVWVHTCSLDGPAALRTYQSRGLRIVDTVETVEDYPDEPLGSWVSTGGV